MTHELKNILGAFLLNRSKGKKSVLATVVRLEGSSYRRPGVRMLISETGEMTGAVSGGCVEKEISRRALEVFQSGTPVLMEYDGRYRLGCEGILYILIEPFEPEEDFIHHFGSLIKGRQPIQISAFYPDSPGSCAGAGSFLVSAERKLIGSRKGLHLNGTILSRFDQTLKPALKVVLFGAEHDAVQLSNFATQAGWEVYIVASLKDPKDKKDFPGADEVLNTDAQGFDISLIDEHTSVVLMSHSYVTDLSYLMRLTDTAPLYIGLLGPARRREKLLNELIEGKPAVSEDFLDRIHGPAGLDIGAETPQEIAFSIMAEILSVIRKTKPEALRYKTGGIHETMDM